MAIRVVSIPKPLWRELTLGFCLLFARSSFMIQATEECRKADGIPVENWNKMLDGQWYWVASVAEGPSRTIKDCSGFRGKKNDESTKLDVIPTDSAAISSAKVFPVDVKKNDVIVPYGEEKCLMFKHTICTYKVGYHDRSNLMCFYHCGPGNQDDYVSCFSRRQSITDAQLAAVNANFKGNKFNLKYQDSLLKKIDRTGCEI